MTNLLMIEVQKDTGGCHAAVIDMADDTVLFVSDTFADVSDAVKAASAWMEDNQ